MTIIIDRIEEDIAVLEESLPTGEVSERRVPMAWLPEDAREGDVLVRTGSGFAVDEKETAKRRAEAAAVLNKLIK